MNVDGGGGGMGVRDETRKFPIPFEFSFGFHCFFDPHTAARHPHATLSVQCSVVKRNGSKRERSEREEEGEKNLKRI
jgi:hypothetical protein